MILPGISGTKSTKLTIKENRGKLVLVSMLFLGGSSSTSAVVGRAHSSFNEAADSVDNITCAMCQ